MSSRHFNLQCAFLLVLALFLGAVPVWGASAIIGSVAGSTSATVGGQSLLPNTTIFSGDQLRVNRGAAVVAMGMGSRMVFGRDTVATFERGPEEVTALLGQGAVSMYQPGNGIALRVKRARSRSSSGRGFKTLGDVALVEGAVVVTAKEGTLHVDGPGRTTEVTKGKTIVIMQNPADVPPQGAGTVAHGMSGRQIATIVTIAAAGTGAGFTIAGFQKTKDLSAEANQVIQNAAAAENSFLLAVSALGQTQYTACLIQLSVSPNSPMQCCQPGTAACVARAE